jgi:hypothetical protein
VVRTRNVNSAGLPNDDMLFKIFPESKLNVMGDREEEKPITDEVQLDQMEMVDDDDDDDDDDDAESPQKKCKECPLT